MYQIVVVLTMFAHFAFLLYLVVGGFLALRWRRTFWLHVPTVAWGIAITAGNLNCPLTWLERWARQRGGMSPLPSEGFVAHYITGVLYPASWLGAVQVGAFALIAVSWACYFRPARRDRRHPG
ncbi:MAG TPA: DUF2784 domain-containing protein [Mycobacterium sp.]|nr:DUF2784 domain-containing protein [Mycobacterium sp.]